MTYKEILNSLNIDRWHSLSEDEKMDFFQSLENYMAMESHRMSCKVNGRFLYTGDEGVVLGVYNPERGEIDINVSQFDEYSLYGKEPDRLVQTCLHEGRHAMQHQVAKGEINFSDRELANEWKHNLKDGNYISYKKNPKAYYNQPVERDAREFAKLRYAALLGEKEQMEKTQEENVDIREVSNVFSEQMESGYEIAADYQSIGNKNQFRQKI